MKNVLLVLVLALLSSTCYARDQLLAQQYDRLARTERDKQHAAEGRGDFAAAQAHKATADQLTAASRLANSPGFQPGMIALPGGTSPAPVPAQVSPSVSPGIITVPVPVPVPVPVGHQVYGGNYGGNYYRNGNGLRQVNNQLQQVNRAVNTIRAIGRSFR